MGKKTKIENLQQYWQEMAQKAGVPEEQAQLISDTLGNEAVSKAFRQAFVAVPDHHSTLDEVKSEAESRMAEYDKWYNETALPAYRTNVAGIERLRRYESQYGDLSNDDNHNDAPSGFRSKEELDKYIEDKFRAQQSGFIGLAKVTPKISLDYYKRFGEVLDLDEVEKISTKHGLPPDVAYERYIAPKVEEMRQKEFEAKLKEAEERGARQALSNHNLPVGDSPRDPSVFFDRQEYTPDKTPTPLQEERMSNEAFSEGWANYEEAGKQQT